MVDLLNTYLMKTENATKNRIWEQLKTLEI